MKNKIKSTIDIVQLHVMHCTASHPCGQAAAAYCGAAMLMVVVLRLLLPSHCCHHCWHHCGMGLEGWYYLLTDSDLFFVFLNPLLSTLGYRTPCRILLEVQINCSHVIKQFCIGMLVDTLAFSLCQIWPVSMVDSVMVGVVAGHNYVQEWGQGKKV